MRKALGMLQEDVAKHLDVNQNAISRIENGAGGGINVLLKLLNFYGNFFVVGHILSQKFEVFRISDTTGPIESVAVERLNMLKHELVEEIENINLLLSKK